MQFQPIQLDNHFPNLKFQVIVRKLNDLLKIKDIFKDPGPHNLSLKDWIQNYLELII